MDKLLSPRRSLRARFFLAGAFLALPAYFILVAGAAAAQEEGPEPPAAETAASPASPDTQLPKIAAAIQAVTTRDVSALSKALNIGERLEGVAAGAPPNTLTEMGDLDGDGVPEMLLKWAIPEVTVGADVAPVPDSRPLWGVYLLSWDGTGWKVSRLVTGVDDFTPNVVNLGPHPGRGIAVIVHESDAQVAYPAIFQFKNHAATLLWDAQSDDSQYVGFLQSQVSFEDHADSPAEMIVTGRADPGFFQVKPTGRRGFQARTVYHWNGNAYIPVKTEYFANQDYTVYRFISALHLHDYASAYALVDPARFLKADSPTLELFRQFIQDNCPEFVRDEVFEAPELPAGSPDEHLFELSKPDQHFVYHPMFSSDGKFLLTGLTRTREALAVEP